MNTAWTHDDVLVNLTEEVRAVREFYNVPTLDLVPDFELVPVRYAQLGDLVPLGKGRVGIVYDVIESRGVEALAIVANSGRTITRSRKAL
jgi:hypothetical protein